MKRYRAVNISISSDLHSIEEDSDASMQEDRQNESHSIEEDSDASMQEDRQNESLDIKDYSDYRNMAEPS